MSCFFKGMGKSNEKLGILFMNHIKVFNRINKVLNHCWVLGCLNSFIFKFYCNWHYESEKRYAAAHHQ